MSITLPLNVEKLMRFTTVVWSIPKDHMQSWDIGELIPFKMPGMEINLAVMSVAVES